MENSEKLINQTRLNELLSCDVNTGVFIWIKKASKYSHIKVGDIVGCLQPNKYKVLTVDGRKYYAHRLVWLYVHGEFPQGEQNFIDHVDGNPSNNCINNLHICSQAENTRNTKAHADSVTGFKGVTYHKVSGKYRAKIQNPLTKKEDSLGLYLTPEEASHVYQLKAIEYSGAFYPDKLLK